MLPVTTEQRRKTPLTNQPLTEAETAARLDLNSRHPSHLAEPGPRTRLHATPPSGSLPSGRHRRVPAIEPPLSATDHSPLMTNARTRK
jgi:hypothetical protein